MKQKLIPSLNRHPYPTLPVGADDNDSDERNLAALEDEQSKDKSRQDIVKTLIMRMYQSRRRWIFAVSMTVQSIVTKYPALRKSSSVS